MRIPRFIMIWYYTILVFISLSISALDQRKELLESIHATYANEAEIKERYQKLQHELNEPGKIHPCESPELQIYNQENTLLEINIEGEVITGDMGQETGFLLILDDSSIVNIPAIIRCIPRLADGKIVIHEKKEMVYYMVLYGTENNTKFELAESTEEIKDNKRVFILYDAVTILKLIKTYNNRFNKKAAKLWFKDPKKHGNGTKECENALKEGAIVFDTPASKWEVAGSKFITGTRTLRIANDFEINIQGYAECVYKIFDTVKKPKKVDRIERVYYTILDLNKKLEPSEHIQIFGPKYIPKNNNKTELFAVNNSLL